MPNNRYGYKKKQELKQQQTAYQARLTRGLFRSAVKWTEKYIETAYLDDFPNWQNRKQIRADEIKREDIIGNPEKVERFLATALYGLEGDTDNTELLDELRTSFYEWISAVGIDPNTCPERLKHFLVGFHEILEGNGERINKNEINKIFEIDPNSKENANNFANSFIGVQINLQNERKTEKLLEGKDWRQLENENKFAGDAEQGKWIFEQIARNHDYQDFHFWPQKNQQSTSSNGGDIKNNPQNWILDKIPTEIDNFRRTKKQEIMVYRRDARLNDFKEGKLNFNGNPIYKWNSFKVQQKFEIKNTLSENKIYLNKAYLTDDEISFVIKEFADNPSVWRIEPIQGNESLIHSSARGNNNCEIGTLIHDKGKFSSQEWVEINEVLELNKQYNIVSRKLKGEISLEYGETHEGLKIWAKELEKRLLINGIRRNADEWEIRKEIVVLDFNEGEVLARKTAKINREEDDYDLTGELINRPNELYKKSYFDDKELAEINSIFNAYRIIEKINQDKGKDNWMNGIVGGINGYEVVLNKETALSSDRKSLNENGEYYKKEQFADSEWAKIKDSINSSRQNQQQSVKELTLLSKSQGDDKNNGIGKIFGILGIITVLVISSVVVIRKKLNKKLKK